MVKGEHRSVENFEDTTQWLWGDPPERLGELGKPSEKLEREIIDQLKEWTSDIANEAHEQSCAIAAKVVLDEFAENGVFILAGTTDKGLLIKFQGTDSFGVCDELDIVGDILLLFADPQHFSAHLRRLADAIDAASGIAPGPPATT